VLAPNPDLGAGVGKTAIAEGLAYTIVNNMSLDGSPLPEFLKHKRILSLDVRGRPRWQRRLAAGFVF
jgi:ATP-dependent Clp protease ATP-binding subunit ClpA